MKSRNIFFTATIWTIFQLIGFRIFQLGFRVYAIIIMYKTLNGTQGSERLKPIIDELTIEQTISNILLAAWFICFLIWFYISYKRAQKHSRQHFSFKPILALFSLIIPIFNIFAPYKIMHEIWSAENRDPSQEDTGKRLINTWWFLSLILVGYSRYLNYQFGNIKELNEFIHSEYYFIVFYGVSIHYYFALRKLLTIINYEQNYRDKSIE